MNTIISKEDFALAAKYVKAGDVVGFHTETVYGLGANALSDEAVQKIFALKGRPSDNPLIVHVHKGYDIKNLVDFDPPYCKILREKFLPGPLTMVYPSTGKVSKFVSCGLNTLAIRVPSSITAQKFLLAANLPVAAPSANISKHVSPVTAKHVYDDFCGKIPLILDGGRCQGGIESTVLDCTGEVPKILRAGLITREMITSCVGACEEYIPKEGERPLSPGMSYSHYLPKCKTVFVKTLQEAKEIYENSEGAYILCEGQIARMCQDFRVLDLGDTGEEMAERLYFLLHEAENKATLLIGIEPKEKGGVMVGVLNRLHRAFGVNV